MQKFFLACFSFVYVVVVAQWPLKACEFSDCLCFFFMFFYVCCIFRENVCVMGNFHLEMSSGTTEIVDKGLKKKKKSISNMKWNKSSIKKST